MDTAAAMISAIAAVCAVIISLVNRKSIHNLHIDVNSRLTQLITASTAAARFEGLEQGRKDQRADIKADFKNGH